MRKQLWTGLFASGMMLALILDAKTALLGAGEAINLCLSVLIPSLFPFIFLSILLSAGVTKMKSGFLRPLGKLLRIPQGSEPLFILGLLGGYPTGAQNVADCYQRGLLTQTEARRFLGFCNNAGPAFLFGMMGALFDDPIYPWLLWGIHILSAVATAILLPSNGHSAMTLPVKKAVTPSQALKKALIVTAQICGWVVLFRILISFLQRWCLWLFPEEVQVFICGILELANGCISLDSIASQGLRFVMASGLLGFGGLCIFMQTMSVTEKLGTGLYFPGKLLQGCISVLLAYGCQRFLFPASQRWVRQEVLYLTLAVVILALLKKRIAFSKKVVYNG